MITKRRFQLIKNMLSKRQPDLTVILENVHKPHNLSAVARTCDAVGIGEIYAVTDSKLKLSSGISRGSKKWVRLNIKKNIKELINELKEKKFCILAADAGPDAVDFRMHDYTKPTAVLFGQELYGVTDEARKLVDKIIKIPMYGMVESLNVSVAAAVILYEAQRQRFENGFYSSQRLDSKIYNDLLFEFCYPKIAQLCKNKGIDYPPLDEGGNFPVDYLNKFNK